MRIPSRSRDPKDATRRHLHAVHTPVEDGVTMGTQRGPAVAPSQSLYNTA